MNAVEAARKIRKNLKIHGIRGSAKVRRRYFGTFVEAKVYETSDYHLAFDGVPYIGDDYEILFS